MKEITIAGGGLAGLSLGIALRQRGVPVMLHEAGDYPRHRVCGEFISGVSPEVLRCLGVEETLSGAVAQCTSAWFQEGCEVFSGSLPAAARGISRFKLDHLLSARLQELGGTVQTKSRLAPEAAEGLVWCAGRVPGRSPWLGLKCHVRGLSLRADLEMHLGRVGYVGLARVEDGIVNVCGLFRQDRALTGANVLLRYLTASGLSDLRNRLETAEIDPSSLAAVAGFAFGWPRGREDLLSLGDACGMIPPFTGNGMSMAFESAALAVEPLAEYSQGRLGWEATRQNVRKGLRRRFAGRLFRAQAMHPFLTHRAGQAFLSAAARARLLPFNLCFHALR